MAQWNSIPSVNNPVCQAPGYQSLENHISDGAGGSIIVWLDYRSGTSAVYAQRIDPNGNILWANDGVRVCTMNAAQWDPKSVSDGNGGVIISWDDSRYENTATYTGRMIYCQRINGAGIVQWAADGVGIFTQTPGCTATNHSIVSDGNGGAILYWIDIIDSWTSMGGRAQRVNSNGVVQWAVNGVIVYLNSNGGLYGYNEMVGDGNGGAIIMWQYFTSTIFGRICVQRIDATGTLRWQTNGVVICNYPYPMVCQITEGTDKGAIISWIDNRNGDYDLFAQSVDSFGVIKWAVDGVPVNQVSNTQNFYSVTTDGNGGAVFAWPDPWRYNLNNADGIDTVYIYAQRLDKNGTMRWMNGGVHVLINGIRQDIPRIAYDNAGSILLTCEDYTNYPDSADIYAQRIDTNGILACQSGKPICTLPAHQAAPQIVASLPVGEGIIAWMDARNGNNIDLDIYASKIKWTTLVSSISIVSSLNSICPGTPVSFTATTIDAGSNPTYQWIKNGTNVGTNSSSYTDASLNDQDIVYCILNNNDLCNPLIVNSNSITITVSAPTVPGITINTATTTICSGNAATFTAAIVDASPIPSYEWKKNGINVGSNAATYTDNVLLDGDVISCVLHAINNCNVLSLTTSNSITVTVVTTVVPAISINGSANDICPGTSVVFSAIAINAGTNPVYRWKKNGVIVGTNTPGYSDNNLANGDIISCEVQSSTSCAAPTVVNSNNIVMIVKQDLPGPVNLGADQFICEHDSIVLDAGAGYTNYIWQDNSVNNTHIVYNPGTYYVTTMDFCGNYYSDTIEVLRYPTPAGFLPDEVSICQYEPVVLKATGNYDQYLWSNNATTPSISINSPGIYWLDVTDVHHCSGRDSVSVKLKDCIKGFFIPTSFTPNGDILNQFFKPTLIGDVLQYHFSVYDRYGYRVFDTQKLNEGWDGTIKSVAQNTSSFVWVCTYQFKNETVHTTKGSVVLIR